MAPLRVVAVQRDKRILPEKQAWSLGGLGVRVRARVEGLGFRVWGLGLRV